MAQTPSALRSKRDLALENHVRDIVAIDFFVVPTGTFPVLDVFLVMSHDRRRILHFNVTTSPSAQWTAPQMVEAFSL